MALLTSYGRREWGTITVLALLAAGAILMFASPWWLALLALLWLAFVAFFRDPDRRPAGEAPLPTGAMLSPADGVISAIEVVDRHEATGGEPAWVLRIFLSIFDVHVNRMPCDAGVVREIYRPGRFHDARTAESARANENNLVILKTPGGEQFGVRQIAGLVARRIVSRLTPGQQVRQGERFGMLKFGSSTELILPRPHDVQCSLTIGERVWCGATVVAVLPPPTGPMGGAASDSAAPPQRPGRR